MNIHNIMAKQGFNKHNLKERTGKKFEEDTNQRKNLIKPTTKVSTLPGGDYHIRKTWVLGRKLGKNPEKELKSFKCF